MRKAYAMILSSCLLLTTSCTTLNESIQLGGSHWSCWRGGCNQHCCSDAGVRPESDTVLAGAAIEMAAGLITSYFTHKEIEQTRVGPPESPKAYLDDGNL